METQWPLFAKEVEHVHFQSEFSQGRLTEVSTTLSHLPSRGKIHFSE